MTGDIVAERRPLGFADRDRLRAARMERAAGRRIDRVGRLAADRAARAPAHRKVGHGVEEHARVRVAGSCEERVGVADLDQSAEIHHPDPGRHEPHHRQIVGDQQIGEAEPLLQIAHEIENLRLDRDVERRGRLVADDQIGVRGDRARDRDPLALAAGEFVRKFSRVGGIEADELEQFARRATGPRACQAAAPASRTPNARIGSAMMSPARQRGLSEANGSWKIICIRRRTARRAARFPV